MKIITVCNQKGGVGKTTTSTALASGLTAIGKSVLLVDCDPQRNSSDTYRANTAEGYPTLADLLFTNEPAVDCIQHAAAGDILAADTLLGDADKHLRGITGYYRLKDRLEPLMSLYDHIILDTPPNLGILLQNALVATEGVIVPVTCGRYALQGMAQFAETLAEVKTRPNPALNVLGLLLVKYDSRTKLSREIIEGLPGVAEILGTSVFETKIRTSIKTEEAQATRTTLFEYAPNSTTAQDYMALIEELKTKGVI